MAENVGYLRPGWSARLLWVAGIAMAIGIVVRLLGLLGAIALPQNGLVDRTMAVVTLVGGIVAFVAFMVLDLA